jgi:hypothetical protein
MPLKAQNKISSRRDLLKPSTTNKKSSGDNGKPCLNPFLVLNKSEEDPFINMQKK